MSKITYSTVRKKQSQEQILHHDKRSDARRPESIKYFLRNSTLN